MTPGDLLQLQRDAGNRAVQRLVGAMLRWGSRGPEVVDLQQKLNGAGAALTPDGIFGAQTHRAVIAFQKAARLGADGVAGPKTQAALEAGGVRIGGGAGKHGGKDPRLVTLGTLLAAIKERLARRSGWGGGQPPAALTQPEKRTGMFDDALDWVEEQVESAGEAVDSAGEWVEEKADAAGEWVEDKVDAAGDWVGEKVDAAGEWVGEKVDAATGWVEDTVNETVGAAGEVAAAVMKEAEELAGQVQELIGDAAGELGEVGDQIAGMLQELLGGTPPTGARLDGLVSQAAAVLASLGGDAEELASGGGKGTLDFSIVAGNDPAFVFDEETFAALRANLTGRGMEMGSATPSAPHLTLNGKSDSTNFDPSEKVKTAKVTIVETVQLPTWTKKDGPKVQEAERKEWTRYAGAMKDHEDLHVADDKSVYGELARSLPEMNFQQAYDAADAATAVGNVKATERDGTNPAPTLMPAGVEKV